MAPARETNGQVAPCDSSFGALLGQSEWLSDDGFRETSVAGERALIGALLIIGALVCSLPLCWLVALG